MKERFLRPADLLDKNDVSVFGGKEGRDFMKLIRNWKKIVGAELSTKVLLKKYDRKVLFVTVPDSMWLQNMMFMKNKILDNVRIYDENITDIRFSVEKRKISDSSTGDDIDFSKVSIGEEEKKRMEEMIRDIPDSGLKERLKQLYIKKTKFIKFSRQSGRKVCKKCNSVYNGLDCPFCGG